MMVAFSLAPSPRQQPAPASAQDRDNRGEQACPERSERADGREAAAVIQCASPALALVAPRLLEASSADRAVFSPAPRG